MLAAAPTYAYGPPDRTIPVRKKADHVPAVQRWSALWPAESVTVGTFGVQARSAELIASSEFMRWVEQALCLPGGPTTVDHARLTDTEGYTHHVVTAYFLNGEHDAWAARPEVESFWSAEERKRDEVGVYRETMTVPTDRIETIYWPDFPGGAMRDGSVKIYPTPYCGYYGAMRDRLYCAATDPISATASAEPKARDGFGDKWRVSLPANVAIIRSSHTWSAMDAEQLADYEAKLAPPLARGMAYLETRPPGCLSLRNATTATPDGAPVPEMHATGVFIDLKAMEDWAETHRSHAAIFSAAVARYKSYGPRNQLRTWHEVFVLPEGTVWEYINCHPGTGVLGYFEAESV